MLWIVTIDSALLIILNNLPTNSIFFDPIEGPYEVKTCSENLVFDSQTQKFQPEVGGGW